MKITINDRRKIFAVQEEFNFVFPFLRLEFFSKPHKPGGASSKNAIKSSKTLSESRTIHNTGKITIVEEMTVTELEQRFRDIYGIEVQVLRKSGNVWLETSITDGWTLKEQNDQGETLSKIINI